MPSCPICSNLFRAADLIRSFKKVAVDQSSEDQRRFNLKQYIGDILLSLLPKLKYSQFDVQVECADDLLIYSYPGAFSQIITNLIMNSLTHGFEGQSSGIMKISIEKYENDIRLQYVDNGKGMDETTLDKIFKPFFSTKRTNGGTGLGLYIVFNLITQTLKGKICCKSNPNCGVVFDITIPFADEIPNGI